MTYPKLWALLFALLLTSCRVPNEQFQDPSSAQSIFRYAEVNPALTITLGEEFENGSQFGIREADHLWRVPISFPGTSWIRVSTDSDDVVRSMHFSYNSGFKFDRELAAYTEELGTPEVLRTESGDEVYTWEDGWTRFDLVRDGEESGRNHYSALTDLSRSGDALEYNWAEDLGEPATLTIDDVLSKTKVWSIVVGKSAELTQTVSSYYPDMPPDTLEMIREIVDRHYAPEALFNDVRAGMIKRDDDQNRSALNSWLFSDQQVELQVLVDEYEPDQSLEEYAAVLGESPPDAERVEPMLRFVRASHVGEFLFDIERERIRATAEILETVPGAHEAPAMPTADERTTRVEEYTMFGLANFLWTHEPLTNEQISLLANSYESASGQWYVRVYTEALMSALATAREKTVRDLSSTL